MSKYKVLACGSNGNFQLGISNDEDQDTLQSVIFRHEDGSKTNYICSRPVKICSGGNHTFILTNTGMLYSAGDNTYGQCAHPININSTHILEFTPVGGNNKWKDVSCGWEFSILMNDSDDIYVCGVGLKGELGLGNKITRSELVKASFHLPSKVVNLKSSINHTIVKLDNGDLYGWGNCRKGQLGNQEMETVNKRLKPRSIIWEPELLLFEEIGLQEYDLGRDCTVILNKNHQIKIYGKGEESYDCDENVIDLKSMWSSNHYLVEDQNHSLTIKSRGNNSHGQLFPNSQVDVSKYEIGSEHGLVLTKQNTVYAWGWGEHGNCGIHTASINENDIEEKVTFGYLNCLYKGSDPVVLLGAGCATSWLCLQTK